MVEKTTGPGYVKREGQEAEELRPRAPQGSAFPGESLPLLQREKAVPIQMAICEPGRGLCTLPVT